MNKLEGSVVVVSGASSGIGEAAAVAFQRAGASVYGLASNSQSLAAAAERHPRIQWLVVDVRKRAEIDAAMARITQGAGRIDVLVNNAGIYSFAPLEATTDTQVREQFDVNVFGLIALTQAALPGLAKARGSVLNVSSSNTRKAMANQSSYAASKAAVESLTRSWALELASQGIRVNAVAPGPTETPGIAKIPMPPEMLEAVKAQVIKLVPLGRMGTSEEVADWIVKLSDPTSTWLTGQILYVDGGLTVA